MVSKKQTYQPTLQVTISSLFITLIIIVSLLLIWHSYAKTKEIILVGTENSFKQIVREVELNFEGTYKPAVQSVELLAFSSIVHADTLEKRLQSLEMFVAALRNVPEMSGLQVGYDSGEYFIVRPLVSNKSKQRFAAPGHAAYVVDNIEESSPGRQALLRMFFDEHLQEITRLKPAPTAYDPRQRPWYTHAVGAESLTATEPYLFYFMRKIGTTLSYKAPGAGAVIGADVTLEAIAKTLAQYKLTPNTELVLLDRQNRVFAYTDNQKVIQQQKDNSFEIVSLPELGKDVLSYIHEHVELNPGKQDFTFNGMPWQGAVGQVKIIEGGSARLLIAAPNTELLLEAAKIRKHAVFLTLATLFLAVPLTWLISRKISSSLQNLATEARKISQFDFSGDLKTRSIISEVVDLSSTMRLMKNTIDQFLSLITSVASEQNFTALLEGITKETLSISEADTVLTYLVDEDGTFLEPATLYDLAKGKGDTVDLPILAMPSKKLPEGMSGSSVGRIHLRKDRDNTFNFLLERMAVDELTIFTFPLNNRQNEPIGLLCLAYKNVHGEEFDHRIAFVRAFSGFAAVTLESRQLLLMQKKLLNSFISLFASAIDAKSPYTGGHCQRVPVITEMLAQAACDASTPPFADFSLNSEEWEALQIASWLHDCGKVTTPEYVVDKATKLETIYDRIHEIRTRFEVLKRDAQIHFWQEVAEGGDPGSLRPMLEKTLQQLDDDFAFVAQCNEGGEFMEQDKVERLEAIARQTWMRTLDDRLGVSWEEGQRKQSNQAASLPVKERLIDDRADHLIKRSESERFAADNPWGFKIDIPKYQYNRGELYNLKISRGTLTAEERYKINDHIVQTIIMLEKLPYPKHLRAVPKIAGGHHETIAGTGYPRKLKGTEMSLTARMMTIADIFEALTASDRPYKKAKTLSQSIKIMDFMRQEGHIDSELFALFLQSGVYLEYGRGYLSPEQIDTVDVDQYLS